MYFITEDTKELPFELPADTKIIVLAGDASACHVLAQRIAKAAAKTLYKTQIVSKMPVYYNSSFVDWGYELDEEWEPDYIVYIVGIPKKTDDDVINFTLVDFTFDEVQELNAEVYCVNDEIDTYDLNNARHMFCHDVYGITPSLTNLYATDIKMLKKLEHNAYGESMDILSLQRDKWRKNVDEERDFESEEIPEIAPDVEPWMPDPEEGNV